jgi:hypothetical protein
MDKETFEKRLLVETGKIGVRKVMLKTRVYTYFEELFSPCPRTSSLKLESPRPTGSIYVAF